MSTKATSLKEAVASIIQHSMDVAKNICQDREWLWLKGDYRDDPDTRKVLKDTGFRFSPKGHELESGDIAHWYFAANIGNSRRRRRKVKARANANAAALADPDDEPTAKATSRTISKNLLVEDADAEFDELFA